MLVEKKLFILKSNLSLPEIKLGDNILELIKLGHINESIDEKGIEFRYTINEQIWIGENDGLVEYLFFTKESGSEFLGFDPFSFPYPQTEPIVKYISQKHKFIGTINSLREVKNYGIGDYMVLVFTDFIPKAIFLIRNT